MQPGLSSLRLDLLRRTRNSPAQVKQTTATSQKHELRRAKSRKFWQRFPRNGGKARRTIARITKTNTSLGRGEGIDGPCAHGMPANGTRNASSSSSRNPNSEQITDRLQGGKTYVGHLQTRISPAHPLLLPLQVPYRPLPAENNTITTVEVLSISNHLKPTLLQPERSARAQTTLSV